MTAVGARRLYGADTLRPWVEAAGAAGHYVVLDLQPGRSDFLSRAVRYQSLLELPHGGLVLDPEWRLGPRACRRPTSSPSSLALRHG